MENKILQTLRLIKFLSSSKLGWDASDVFLRGECGSLFFIMKALFKEDVTSYGLYLYNRILCHILICYQEDFYDINGIFSVKDYLKSTNFTMYRAEDLLYCLLT